MNDALIEEGADAGLDDLSTLDQIVMLGLAFVPIILATWWHASQVLPA